MEKLFNVYVIFKLFLWGIIMVFGDFVFLLYIVGLFIGCFNFKVVIEDG